WSSSTTRADRSARATGPQGPRAHGPPHTPPGRAAARRHSRLHYAVRRSVEQTPSAARKDVTRMRTAEIRERWLRFFEENGHTVVPSASVISSDPSILFNIAGMVQFIPYLTGREPAPFPRATSVQKCVRTQDIEEVGKTT